MSTPEVTTRLVDIGDLKLNVHEAGEGDALLLVHGGGPGASGWSNFGANVPALAERFRVIVIDQPGYGDSDKPDIIGDYWEFAAGCINKLLDELGVPVTHIIGNSLGGGTAVRTALDYADRVDRLILLGPAGVSLSLLTPRPSEGVKVLASFYDAPGPSTEKMYDFVRMMAYDPMTASDEFVAERLAAAVAPGAEEGATRAVRSVLRSPQRELWRRLHEVQHKTLLIWGRDDRVVPVDGALFALQQMPHADLHVFSQCGHWAQAERRDEFNRLAIDFLSQ